MCSVDLLIFYSCILDDLTTSKKEELDFTSGIVFFAGDSSTESWPAVENMK